MRYPHIFIFPLGGTIVVSHDYCKCIRTRISSWNKWWDWSQWDWSGLGSWPFGCWGRLVTMTPPTDPAHIRPTGPDWFLLLPGPLRVLGWSQSSDGFSAPVNPSILRHQHLHCHSFSDHFFVREGKSPNLRPQSSVTISWKMTLKCIIINCLGQAPSEI